MGNGGSKASGGRSSVGQILTVAWQWTLWFAQGYVLKKLKQMLNSIKIRKKKKVVSETSRVSQSFN